MFSGHDYANMILNIVLISCFVGIFYFTYAAKVEQTVIQNQVQLVVDSFTNNVSNVVDTQQYQNQINNFLTISPTQQSNFDQMDASVAANNEKLLLWSGLFFVIFFILGIISVFFIWKKNKDFSLLTLISRNIILLFAIALTEFSFLYFIASNYMTADTNYVKKIIIDSIRNYKSITTSP